MSGTEVTLSMLVIYGMQVVLLPFQIINYLSRKIDHTRLRFLVFNLVFIAFNTLWIIPQSSWSMNPLSHEILLIYAGLGLVGWVYYYIIKETGIDQGHFTVRFLMLLLLGLQSFQFASQLYLTDSYNEFLKYLFAGLFQAVCFMFVIRTFVQIVKSQELKKPIMYASLIALAYIAVLPFILYVFQSVELKNLYINLSFFILVFAYLKQHISQMILEDKVFSKRNTYSHLNLNERSVETPDPFFDLKLTERQYEVAVLLVQGFSYQEIEERLYIAESTARKHGEHIFNKAGIPKGRRLEEFRERYPKLPENFMH